MVLKIPKRGPKYGSANAHKLHKTRYLEAGFLGRFKQMIGLEETEKRQLGRS